jgi:hypothetical protein
MGGWPLRRYGGHLATWLLWSAPGLKQRLAVRTAVAARLVLFGGGSGLSRLELLVRLAPAGRGALQEDDQQE